MPLEHTAADGPLADSNTAHWPASLRVIFRFVYAYVFLYALYGLTYVYAFLSAPFVKGNFRFPIDEALSRFMPWFAAHILRIHQTITYAPSGDASFSWIEHLLFLLVAVLAAVLWSVLDGNRPHYRLADQQLRLLVRLTLASLMFAYGFDKVYPTQFHSVTRTDLVTQFGDLNHFNLMWHFMAASKGYTIFSGLLEVLAGVLLLIPMFTNVGALVTVVVMSNVVALNLAYNIPVKLFSSHILLMALFLVAPLVPRLARVLILNRAVPPERPARLSSNSKVDRFARIALVSLGAIMFFAFLFEQRAHYAEIRKAEAAPVPLQGIWLVDQFVSSNPRQPLLNATTAQKLHVLPGDDRWLRLIFDHRGELAIQGLNGEINYVAMALDKTHTSASLTDPGDDAWKANLTLDQPAPDKLHLKGIVNGAPVEASLHRIDESHFAVKDEGLHLVNR